VSGAARSGSSVAAGQQCRAQQRDEGADETEASVAVASPSASVSDSVGSSVAVAVGSSVAVSVDSTV
jgi:hypothetical protein